MYVHVHVGIVNQAVLLKMTVASQSSIVVLFYIISVFAFCRYMDVLLLF